jgi:hypothetical protein
MRVNDFFDRVVVINLDRRTDRMDKLDPQLKELGIEYERFSAVDGKELDIKGYVAGTMSHVAVWKKYRGQKILMMSRLVRQQRKRSPTWTSPRAPK